MKVTYKHLLSAGFILTVLSCTTTKEILQNDDISTTPMESETEEVVAEPSPEQLYLALLDDVEVAVASSPAAVNVGRDFAKPFVFCVKHADGTAFPDFDLEITYPSEKKGAQLLFETVTVKTDSDGLFTITFPKTSFAASAFVQAKPAVLFDDDGIKSKCEGLAANAPYKVRSDITTKGAVLFVWDYNERGRPTNNSYEVLSEFRTRGMTMTGNAPISESSYIGKSLSALYKANYEIIEDAYGYLICGDIKFDRPVEADGDEYVCAMTATINGIRMKDGEVVYSQSFSHQARGKNWTACTSKCKEEIAKLIVDSIVFGL